MAVVVVGSINVDMAARVDRIPEPGETYLAQEGWMGPGGKGANQAVAARRQGSDTRMVGIIGDDPLAAVAVSVMRECGVVLDDVKASRLRTGLALIWVDRRGHNTITVIPGANHGWPADFFNPGPALQSADVVLISLEIPLPVAVQAAIWARRYRCQVLVDPAPAPETLPVELWRADLLMPNRGEAERLLGIPIRSVRDAKQAVQQLRRRGADVGIIKLGGDGLVYAARHGVFYVPAVPITAVDTTGAGDAFAGVVAAGLAHGETVAESVRRAGKAAAFTCTRTGAQFAFPTAEEIGEERFAH